MSALARRVMQFVRGFLRQRQRRAHARWQSWPTMYFDPNGGNRDVEF
jgi:hypothetical protein